MTKRVRVPFIGLVTVMLCFALAFGLTVQTGSAASAAPSAEAAVTLTDTADFTIDADGKLTGLSERGLAKVAAATDYAVVIPASVKTIASKTFAGQTKLVKVSFAENSALTEISNADRNGRVYDSNTGVFANCTSLREVVLPQSPATDGGTLTIGQYAFYSCVGLEAISLPAHAETIAGTAFRSCDTLTAVWVAKENTAYTNFYQTDGTPYDGMVYTKDPETGAPSGIGSVYPSGIKEVTLPAAIVEDEAFDFYTLDNSLKLLESLRVEENAMYYAYGNALYYKDTAPTVEDGMYWAFDLAYMPTAIRELGIPKEFNHAWDETSEFDGMEYYSELRLKLEDANNSAKLLQTIVVETGNSVFSSLGGALYNADQTDVLYLPPSLTEFTASSQLQLNAALFANTTGLKSIVVPEDHPDYTSFEGIVYTKDLTEVKFVPSAIEEVYIPASVTTIGEGTFERCTHVAKVYVYDLEKWCGIDFYTSVVKSDIGSWPRWKYTSSNPLLSKSMLQSDGDYLSVTSSDLMLNNTDLYLREGDAWVLQTDLILDFDGEINDHAFAGCGSITSVDISEKLQRIGAYSFALCPNLVSMTVPFVGEYRYFEEGNTEKIYNAEFSYVYGGGELGSMGNFSRPRKLQNVTVDGCNEWKTRQEEDCYGLPASAFRNCAATNYTLKLHTDNPTFDGTEPTFANSAFGYCQAERIDTSGTKFSVVRNSVFSGCEQLRAIELPDTVTTIEMQAFYGCSALTKIELPDSVTRIDRWAFQNCSGLVSVRLPAGLRTVDSDAFDGCRSLKTVWVTGTNIDAYSFPSLAPDYNIVAVSEDVYKALPSKLTTQLSWDVYTKTYYVADVTFELYDDSGRLLKAVTEQHLASWNEGSNAYLNYRLTTDENGNEYWAQDDTYVLPTSVGEYTVDSGEQWMMNGVALTPTSVLTGKETSFIGRLDASSIKITPVDVQKSYNGQAWTFVSDSMNITGITAVAGGNGYTYRVRDLPTDAGTYTVTVACKSGYVWADGEGDTRTFTLTITPASATLAWWYMFGGDPARDTNVTGTVPERAYNGKGTRSYLRAEFTDVNGKTQTIDYRNFSLYAAGDHTVIVDALRNVGLYDFVVNDEGDTVDKTEWIGNYVFNNDLQQFRITPYQIDLNSYASLAWGLQGYNSNLRDATLYMYGGKPYTTLQTDKGALEGVRNVTRSMVRYRDKALTVEINAIPALLFGTGNMYQVAYTENAQYTATAKEIGKYTACAVLTLDAVQGGNYEFVYGLGEDLWARGMSITLNPDGTATVTKEWYIAEMGNGLRSTVITDADGHYVEYDMAFNWTYGDASVTIGDASYPLDSLLVAPRLEHGDEAEATYLTNGNVRFILYRNEQVIATTASDNSFARDRFTEYLNKSMPAGVYRLQVTVTQTQSGTTDHTHWWNGETHDVSASNVVYNGFTREFNFTVAEKTAAAMYTAVNSALQNKTFTHKYAANTPQFVSGVDVSELVSIDYVPRQGYWNTAAAAAYYSTAAALTFNVEGMDSFDYLAADAFIGNDFAPVGVGSYTVYYQVAVANYQPLVENLNSAVSDRKSYKFTVVIYDEVDVPTVSSAGLVYTGSKVLPDLAESELYEVIWDTADEYVAGGAHSVTFSLYDDVHYRWKGVSGKTAAVPFTIGQAQNEWVRVPNIVDWQFESFDTQINRIRAVAKYLDAGKHVTFSIVKEDGTAIDGLTGFTVNDDGTVDDATLVAALNGLKFGAYMLKVSVEATGNYYALDHSVDFRIDKAINTWADGDEDLALPSWIVGKYDAEANPIVVNAAHGVVNVVICDVDGNEYYNSVTGVNKLNECAVGKYLLKAWVDETEDFAALAERTFTIEVLDKVGMPWWGTLLITLGALLVAAAILLILWKKGVFQILTGKIVLAIRTRASVDATIASVRAAKKMEEGKKSVEEAKKRERIEELKQRAAEHRALPAEERAAALETKAAAEAEKAERIRARSEAMRARAERMRGAGQAPAAETQTEAAATQDSEPTAEE